MKEFNLKNGLIYLNVLLMMFISMVFVYSQCLEVNISSFLKYFLCLEYVFIVLTSRFFFKWSHSYILFLLSFGLFLLGRVFLDVIGFADIFEANKLTWYTLSYEVVSKVLLLFIISLFCINTSALINHKTYAVIHENVSLNVNYKLMSQIFFFSLILLLPGTLFKLWFDYQQIKQYGYLIVFMGDRLPAPLFARASWFLLKAILPLYLIMAPNKKEFRVFVFLTLLIDLTSIISGNRSTLIAPLAFLFWYYYKYYSQKSVKVITLSIIGCMVIIFSIIAINLRDNSDVEKFDFPLYAKLFVNSQGVSYLVTAYYFDFHEQLIQPSPFAAFNGIQNYFLRGKVKIGHNVEYASRTVSLDHKITYAVAPDKYLSGSGLGSSFLIELFEMGGWLAIILGTFLLGYCIVELEYLFDIFPKIRYLSWFWIVHLFEMSRAGLLPNIPNILMTVFALFMFKVLIGLRRKTIGNLYG